MKTFIDSASLLASLIGVGVLFAMAQTHQSTKNDDRPAEEVRRLNGEEVEAFLHNDPKTMARLWSDDFRRYQSLEQILKQTAGSGNG